MEFLARLRYALWHPTERRSRAPIRLVAGGAVLVIAVLAAQLATLAALGDRFDQGSAVLFGVSTVVTGVAVVLALGPVARLVDRRRVADYGLRFDREWWVDCGFGLGLGVALQAAVFLVGWVAGWFTVTGTMRADGPFLLTFAGLGALFLAVGIYEELLVRGWLLTNVAEGVRFVGERAAVVVALGVSSGLFGLLHANNPNATPLSVAIITLAGVMLAAGYLLTGELAIPIGLHVTWNLAQGAVFGHGVSGLDSEATLIATEATGPSLWTGGAFGPEGGLLGVAAIGLGCVAIAGWVRFRGGTVRLHSAVTTPDLVTDADPNENAGSDTDRGPPTN